MILNIEYSLKISIVSKFAMLYGDPISLFLLERNLIYGFALDKLLYLAY